jgi:hypothetical protein
MTTKRRNTGILRATWLPQSEGTPAVEHRRQSGNWGLHRLPAFGQQLTLAKLFAATIGRVSVLVAGLFVIFFESSKRSMLSGAQRVRESAAMRVEAEVHTELHQGAHTLQNIERVIRAGVVDVSLGPALEMLLTTELLNDEEVAEVTFTHADRLGFGANGSMGTEPRDRWQLSVFRSSAGPADAVLTRTVEPMHEHALWDQHGYGHGGSFRRSSESQLAIARRHWGTE